MGTPFAFNLEQNGNSKFNNTYNINKGAYIKHCIPKKYLNRAPSEYPLCSRGHHKLANGGTVHICRKISRLPRSLMNFFPAAVHRFSPHEPANKRVTARDRPVGSRRVAAECRTFTDNSLGPPTRFRIIHSHSATSVDRGSIAEFRRRDAPRRATYVKLVPNGEKNYCRIVSATRTASFPVAIHNREIFRCLLVFSDCQWSFLSARLHVDVHEDLLRKFA